MGAYRYGASKLVFSVPFQHRYGYIRDEYRYGEVATKTRGVKKCDAEMMHTALMTVLSGRESCYVRRVFTIIGRILRERERRHAGVSQRRRRN